MDPARELTSPEPHYTPLTDAADPVRRRTSAAPANDAVCQMHDGGATMDCARPGLQLLLHRERGSVSHPDDLIPALIPDPRLQAAANAAASLEEILLLIDEYAPELLVGTVPPDANLYPYLVDGEGQLWAAEDVNLPYQWEDTYEDGLNV